MVTFFNFKTEIIMRKTCYTMDIFHKSVNRRQRQIGKAWKQSTCQIQMWQQYFSQYSASIPINLIKCHLPLFTPERSITWRVQLRCITLNNKKCKIMNIFESCILEEKVEKESTFFYWFIFIALSLCNANCLFLRM